MGDWFWVVVIAGSVWAVPGGVLVTAVVIWLVTRARGRRAHRSDGGPRRRASSRSRRNT